MLVLYCIIAFSVLFTGYARWKFYCGEKECTERMKALLDACREREESVHAYLDFADAYPIREKETISHIRRMLAYPERTKNRMFQMSLESALGILMKGLMIKVDSYPYIYENKAYRRTKVMLEASMSVVRMKAKPYNEAAEEYNRLLEAFGFIFAAELFRLERMPVYETEDAFVTQHKVVF